MVFIFIAFMYFVFLHGFVENHKEYIQGLYVE